MNSYTCRNTGLGSYQKWFVGNDIREILLAESSITEQVGTDIFPLVAPENTEGDFIVYNRSSYSKKWVKQGVYEDECSLAIVAVCDNYDKSVSLASKIDNALTGRHSKENIVINIELTDSMETFEDNKYIQTLVFSIK